MIQDGSGGSGGWTDGCALSRRQLLLAGAVAMTSACARKPRRSAPPRRAAPPSIAARVEAMAATRTEDIVALGAGWLRAGATPTELLSVAFHVQILAGATSDLHATFVAPAIAEVLPELTKEEGRLAALWSLQFAGEWLIGEDRPGAAPQTDLSISGAVAAGDASAARAATHAACAAEGWRAAARELAPFTMRAFGDPHTPIFLCQVVRGIERFGAEHAHVLLARVADGLAGRARAGAPGWDAARAMAPDVLAQEVAGMWGGRPVWSAITVAASELLPVAPGASGIGVHGTTMVDAAAALAGIAKPADASLIAFQASQWVRRLQAQHDFMVAPPPADLPDPDVAMGPAMVDALRRSPHEPHDYKYVASFRALSRRLDPDAARQVAAPGAVGPGAPAPVGRVAGPGGRARAAATSRSLTRRSIRSFCGARTDRRSRP